MALDNLVATPGWSAGLAFAGPLAVPQSRRRTVDKTRPHMPMSGRPVFRVMRVIWRRRDPVDANSAHME